MITRRKKRPIPRFKPAMAQAIARTKAARRKGLISQDCVPSATPAGRARYDQAYQAKHAAAYNARRRAQRAVLKTLRTADPMSQEWIGACLKHAHCPPDHDGQIKFLTLMRAFRAGLYVFTAE